MLDNYPKLLIEYDGDKQTYSYKYVDNSGHNVFGDKNFYFAKPFRNGLAFVKHNKESKSNDIITSSGNSVFESLISDLIETKTHLKYEDNLRNLFDVLKIIQCCVVYDINKRNDFSITAQKFYVSENLFLIKLNLFHINSMVEKGLNNRCFCILFADWEENLPAIITSKKINAEDENSLYHDLYFYLNLDDFKFYGPFEDANIFSEGKAAVKPFGYNYGFLDKEFIFDYDHQYQECFPFSNGISKIKINNKFGFIDHFNNTIIPSLYDSATSFQHGFSIVGNFENKIKRNENFDPFLYKWEGRRGNLAYSNSFGLILDVINPSGKSVVNKILDFQPTFISRPKQNALRELYFNINEFGFLQRSQGVFNIKNAGNNSYYKKILHYEMESYYSPKMSFKLLYDESYFYAEIDSSYYEILCMNYLDFEISMYSEINEAYNDAEADRYFSDPGLAFDSSDDIWNID